MRLFDELRRFLGAAGRSSKGVGAGGRSDGPESSSFNSTPKAAGRTNAIPPSAGRGADEAAGPRDDDPRWRAEGRGLPTRQREDRANKTRPPKRLAAFSVGFDVKSRLQEGHIFP